MMMRGAAAVDPITRTAIYGAPRLDVKNTLSQLGVGGLFDFGYRLVVKAIAALYDVKDFNQILTWIYEAETCIKSGGAERGKWVREQVDRILPLVWPEVKDLLISSALLFLAKRGHIHLKAIEPS